MSNSIMSHCVVPMPNRKSNDKIINEIGFHHFYRATDARNRARARQSPDEKKRWLFPNRFIFSLAEDTYGIIHLLAVADNNCHKSPSATQRHKYVLHKILLHILPSMHKFARMADRLIGAREHGRLTNRSLNALRTEMQCIVRNRRADTPSIDRCGRAIHCISENAHRILWFVNGSTALALAHLFNYYSNGRSTATNDDRECVLVSRM